MRIIFYLFIFFLNLPAFTKDIDRDLVKKVFNSLIIEGPFLKNSNIELKKLSDIISIEEWNSSFSPEISWFYENENAYAVKYDFDKDGIDEVALLQISGSGQYPSFHICKYDNDLKYYKSVFTSGKLIYPILIKKQLYFFEKHYDMGSGRLKDINLMKVNKKLRIKKLYTFSILYHYEIPLDFESILNDEILEKNSKFDFSYLKQDNVVKSDKYNYSYQYNDFIVKIKIHHNTVGHLSSYIDIDLYNCKEGYHLIFEGLLGFNFLKVNNHYILVITQTNNIEAHTAMIARKLKLYNLQNSISVALTPKMILE